MKVGDLVRQSNRMLKFYDDFGNEVQRKKSSRIGLIVKVRERNPDYPERFIALVGPGIDILWADGKLNENCASRNFEVVE